MKFNASIVIGMLVISLFTILHIPMINLHYDAKISSID